MKPFNRFLRSLNDAGVDYVVVGGYAVMFHGYPRSTDDLDLLYRPSRDNCEKIAVAVTPYVAGVTPEDFEGPLDEFAVIRIGDARIDMLPELSGIDTEEALRTAVAAELFDIPVRFISKELLLANKRSTTRLKDQADAEELDKDD